MRYGFSNSTPAGISELKTVQIPFKSHLVASYDMQGTGSGYILHATILSDMPQNHMGQSTEKQSNTQTDD